MRVAENRFLWHKHICHNTFRPKGELARFTRFQAAQTYWLEKT